VRRQALQQVAIEFARRELNIDMIERDAQRSFGMKVGKNVLLSVCRECRSRESTVGERGPDHHDRDDGELAYVGSDQGLLFSINAHMWTSSVPLLKCGTEQLDSHISPTLGDSAVMPLNH
jgi:hypothetical protein